MVDDFAPWRQFVNSRFQGQSRFQVIGIASDGLEAVQKAEELRPDLVLMDVGLPKLNGIEAARQILKIMPNSKILFLSQNLDPDVARSALAAGAKGYVTKSDAHKELLTAVMKVVSVDQYVSR